MIYKTVERHGTVRTVKPQITAPKTLLRSVSGAVFSSLPSWSYVVRQKLVAWRWGCSHRGNHSICYAYKSSVSALWRLWTSYLQSRPLSGRAASSCQGRSSARRNSSQWCPFYGTRQVYLPVSLCLCHVRSHHQKVSQIVDFVVNGIREISLGKKRNLPFLSPPYLHYMVPCSY